MQAPDNAYAAPQTTDFRAAKELRAPRFPVSSLWQGAVQGITAGLIASLSLILLYLVGILSGFQANVLNLLLNAGVILGVTIALGFIWGIADACFAAWLPNSFVDLNLAANNDDNARGET